MTAIVVAPYGFSKEAQDIAEATAEDRRLLDKSSAVGFGKLQCGELMDAWVECRLPGWDGYDALPVSARAFMNMLRFLGSLPLGFCHPTIGADPHGWLSAEWYRKPRRVLSVSVTDDSLLHYAALLGTAKTCGTEVFFDSEIPDSILTLARRVCS
ncbi:MAG: hypothetical protein JXO22_17900 [Phycisphaerae bacterium]|nr:hypothetical protein [Phycisphaerae bacterium]